MGADDEPPETSEYSLDPTQQSPGPTQRSPGPADDSLEPTRPHGPPVDPTPGVIPGIVLDNRYRLEELLGRGAAEQFVGGAVDLCGRAAAV